MAELILLMGESSTGKSTSLRHLPANKTFYIKPNSKSFPFPAQNAAFTEANKNLIVTSDLTDINTTITDISDNAKHINFAVIEDFTHFFSATMFADNFVNALEKNKYEKWNVFGANVFKALFADSPKWRKDLYVIVIHHTEVKDDGMIGFKTSGKLLDNTINVPSYFNYILHTVVKNDGEGKPHYMIQTNIDGGRVAKSPYGVLPELYMESDMVPILKRIILASQGKLEIPVF